NLAALFNPDIASPPGADRSAERFERPQSQPGQSSPSGIGRRHVLKLAAGAGIGSILFGIGAWVSRYSGWPRGHTSVPAGPVGKEPIKIKAPAGIAVSDDGRQLAVLSEDQLVLFDPFAGSELGRAPLAFNSEMQQGGVAFTGSSGLLALGTNQSATASRL